MNQKRTYIQFGECHVFGHSIPLYMYYAVEICISVPPNWLFCFLDPFK